MGSMVAADRPSIPRLPLFLSPCGLPSIRFVSNFCFHPFSGYQPKTLVWQAFADFALTFSQYRYSFYTCATRPIAGHITPISEYSLTGLDTPWL
jgi:hypothetical protein